MVMVKKIVANWGFKHAYQYIIHSHCLLVPYCHAVHLSCCVLSRCFEFFVFLFCFGRKSEKKPATHTPHTNERARIQNACATRALGFKRIDFLDTKTLHILLRLLHHSLDTVMSSTPNLIREATKGGGRAT